MISTNYFKVFLTALFAVSLVAIAYDLAAYQDMKPMPESADEKASAEKLDMGKGPMSKKKEYETIEEFLEDGEYENIDGFLNIYKETKKNK